MKFTSGYHFTDATYGLPTLGQLILYCIAIGLLSYGMYWYAFRKKGI